MGLWETNDNPSGFEVNIDQKHMIKNYFNNA